MNKIIIKLHVGAALLYYENPTLDVGFRKAFSDEALNKDSF